MSSNPPKTKTVIAGALGECVHVDGVTNFLRLAEQAGWRTVFLGPAVSSAECIEIPRRENAELVGGSYQLTPETGERLLGDFAESADDLRTSGVRFIFGGTPPVVARARTLGFFDICFDGHATFSHRYLTEDIPMRLAPISVTQIEQDRKINGHNSLGNIPLLKDTLKLSDSHLYPTK